MNAFVYHVPNMTQNCLTVTKCSTKKYCILERKNIYDYRK